MWLPAAGKKREFDEVEEVNGDQPHLHRRITKPGMRKDLNDPFLLYIQLYIYCAQQMSCVLFTRMSLHSFVTKYIFNSRRYVLRTQ